MRGRKTLTDIKVNETLAQLRSWLVGHGEANPEDSAHAAASGHWARHCLPEHPNPCCAKPCKAAAISAVALELIMYGQADESLQLLDALATTTDETAATVLRLPRRYSQALQPIQRALKGHRRRGTDGRYRHSAFRDGRVLVELPELVGEGLSIL